jgi:hypothetical protein
MEFCLRTQRIVVRFRGTPSERFRNGGIKHGTLVSIRQIYIQNSLIKIFCFVLYGEVSLQPRWLPKIPALVTILSGEAPGQRRSVCLNTVEFSILSYFRCLFGADSECCEIVREQVEAHV